LVEKVDVFNRLGPKPQWQFRLLSRSKVKKITKLQDYGRNTTRNRSYKRTVKTSNRKHWEGISEEKRYKHLT